MRDWESVQTGKENKLREGANDVLGNSASNVQRIQSMLVFVCLSAVHGRQQSLQGHLSTGRRPDFHNGMIFVSFYFLNTALKYH